MARMAADHLVETGLEMIDPETTVLEEGKIVTSVVMIEIETDLSMMIGAEVRERGVVVEVQQENVIEGLCGKGNL